MTHNANKRRDHNDAARAAKQRVRGKAGKAGPGIRRTGYGQRLAAMRRRAAGGDAVGGDAVGDAAGDAAGGEEE